MHFEIRCSQVVRDFPLRTGSNREDGVVDTKNLGPMQKLVVVHAADHDYRHIRILFQHGGQCLNQRKTTALRNHVPE